MATKQYIGARYVPKVFDNNGSSNWVSGIEYEPLTIVTYLGNSYTSKKPVPNTIGSPNANPEYWVNTGDYTGIVNYLSTRVNGLSDKVDAVQSEWAKRMTLANRKFIFIGDSYMAGESAYGIIKSYTGYIIDYLGLTLNVNCYVGAHSGYGFKDSGFKTLLGEVSNNISAEDKLTITDIIVCGGINDASLAENNSTLLLQHISDFIYRAKYLFPNASIKIGQISKDIDGRFHYNKASIEMYKCCTLYGAEYLTGSETILRRLNNFYNDGHPNQEGMKILARYLINCILNNSCSVSYNTITAPIVADESVTSIDSPNAIRTSANGDNVTVNIINAITTEFPSRSFQTTDYVVAGSFSDGYIIGNETPFLINADGIVWINGTAERRMIKIAFVNKKLYLYPYDVLNILSNVTKIRILPNVFTFSTYDI